jgi:hypothetical protein
MPGNLFLPLFSRSAWGQNGALLSEGLVGGFVINFGAIEVESYEWIRRLSKNGKELEVAMDRNFGPRVRIIRQLLGQATIRESLQLDAKKVWDEAAQLAEFRNVIAHNPIVFVWAGRQAEGEPDAVEVLDYKSAEGEG